MQPVVTNSQDNLLSAPTVEEIEAEDEDDEDEEWDDVNDLIASLTNSDPSKPNTVASSIVKRRKTSLDVLEKKRKRLFISGSKFAPVQRNEIVGIDNVLDQIDGVISWLQNYDVYTKYKARPEPGVLFAGQPGTGKTYTSRYIATASGAVFVDVRDFPYSGMTYSARDIKSLFQHARTTHQETGKPVILFWDEFETYAQDRTRSSNSAVVSQLTAELDGICGKPAGILLIGCTNYGYNIDKALKRPGRMGLQVEFNAPSRSGKKILLKHYVNKINAQAIDYDVASYYFNDQDVAATLEEAVQEAWRLAVKRFVTQTKKTKEPILTEAELLEAFLDRLVGPPPAFVELTDEGRYRTAVHETGHALAAILMDVPLRLVTIRPGKAHLGKTMFHTADPMTSDLAEYLHILRVTVAGPVAESVLGIGRQAGAEGDTQQATSLARHLIDNEGFGERTGMFNPAGVGITRARQDINPSVSEGVLTESDRDVKELIFDATRDIEQRFIEFGAPRIDKIAKALVKATTLTGKQFKVEVDKVRHGA